jgi:hypothetical protein
MTSQNSSCDMSFPPDVVAELPERNFAAIGRVGKG